MPTRASQPAIEKALAAVKAAGLAVDSLLVEGGKVSIKIANGDEPREVTKDGGLKSWRP